jgi:hypothetical protein
MGRVLLMVIVAGMVWAQGPVMFMGRVVTVTKPGYEDAEQTFPKGPATVCIEGTPRLCFKAPEKFGRDPEVSIVQIAKNTSAIFFLAAGGGTSGWQIHFALLRPGTGKEFDNLFPTNLTISSQSEHDWWTDSTISDAKIFVTADYVWGPGECHVCDHRYMISAYVLRSQKPLLDDDNWQYDLQDRYMTARKYSEDDKVLNAEKPEIIARLKRVKQQSAR